MTARRVEGFDATDFGDRDLTLAFQRGEDGAYDAIHERHSARVQGVCRRMLTDAGDAQEAAQETFLRVFTGLSNFNGRYQLGAWIARIATNVCLDMLRAKSRRPADLTPIERIDLDNPEPADESDPEFLYLRRTEGRRIRRVLDALPPLHRAAIVLRDFEGLSYAEIAEVLDLNDSQVKALLHRARRGFRRSWPVRALIPVLPARLWDRIRAVEGGAREQTIQTATSAGQFAASCSGVIQQCGQLVGDRVAPVMAAVLIGTSGAAASAVPVPAPETPSARTLTAAATTVTQPAEVPETRSKKRPTGSEAPASPAPAAPSPQPAPTTAPTPAPTAAPSPTPTPAPSPTASPPGTGLAQGSKQQFSAVIGFDWGEPIDPIQATSHRTTADCDTNTVDQTLEIPVSARDERLPGKLLLHTDTGIGFDLTMKRGYSTIRYMGSGLLTEASREGDRLTLQYSGSYSSTTKTHRPAGLPGSGRFAVGLTLDCAASTVVTESVVFATQ